MNKLIESVYNPPLTQGSRTLSDYYSSNNRKAYSYSLARHALKVGLKSIGIKSGSSVLIPSFICRDVLAPFNELGMSIIFYNLNRDLFPVESFDSLPKADAILAIHYFGLETNLVPFKDYCQKNNAILIEDNAHGLFSRNSEGHLLGLEGSFSIISVRKSLPIQNGAILLIDNKSKISQEKIQDHISLRLKLKNLLRPLVAKLGIKLLLVVTRYKRNLRKLLKGNEFPISEDQDELTIPFLPNPVNMESYFSTVDIDKEIQRRRELFKFLNEFLSGNQVEPLRKSLLKFEVPYAYPFYCEARNVQAIRSRLLEIGLEIVNWPALPSKVLLDCPSDFYRNLYLVKFLW